MPIKSWCSFLLNFPCALLYFPNEQRVAKATLCSFGEISYNRHLQNNSNARNRHITIPPTDSSIRPNRVWIGHFSDETGGTGTDSFADLCILLAHIKIHITAEQNSFGRAGYPLHAGRLIYFFHPVFLSLMKKI